jgi:hypothetical protein
MPGAGKSVLASAVVDDIMSRYKDNVQIGIAYLYCDYRNQSEQRPEDLLASLLKQLSHKKSNLPGRVTVFYERPDSRQRQHPSFSEISGAVESILQTYNRAFIIVDGLDECRAQNGWVSKIMAKLSQYQVRFRASVLITSRPVQDLIKKQGQYASINIRATAGDVRKYVSSRLKQLPSQHFREKALVAEIQRAIVESVDGM